MRGNGFDGALAAAKLHIRVGHVEAGFVSFDRMMPEEINRVVADHISDLLFAPTETARQHLLNEGIEDKTISVTGNTIVDAVFQNRDVSKEESEYPWHSTEGLFPRHCPPAGECRFSRAPQKHHPGDPRDPRGILTARPHPDAPPPRKMVEQFNIPLSGITVIEPTGFFEFLHLESNARLILTDSGGVQEESCILGVPCVTLRNTTERPETIDVGANMLVGTGCDRIRAGVNEMVNARWVWENPYGDGRARVRIVESILGMKF